MFRNVPAMLLTFCLVPVTSALAQSATAADPTPPAHHEGREHGRPGFGGPGGFRGPVSHSVAPIANAPFSATYTATANMENREGKQVSRSTTRTVYRDSLGRTREDVTLPPPPPRAAAVGTQESAPAAPASPRVMTVIVDPVANTITHLNVERKTAFVESVPAEFFTHDQKGPGAPTDGSPRHDHGGTTTELGSKTFAGVVAQGKRTTHAMPGPDTEAGHTATRESWYSPDLKVEVSETDTTPSGTRSETVTSLTKAEPAASLFKVPEGYAIKQAPEHPFHGRPRGEHGGPGDGPGFDGPPAPPPAM